jgi:hypothetical protein
VVFSLRTATAGGSGRGRLYWPATGIALSTTTMRVPAATVTAVLAAVESYLTSIKTAIDATLDGISLAVWSRTLESTANVTTIQMGDVVDTQRRRRDTLVETYQSIAHVL